MWEWINLALGLGAILATGGFIMWRIERDTPGRGRRR